MRILDLYCGAGLVADGLMAAGCEVVGVDLYPQPHYPGPFLRHDALALDMRFLRSFDFIWASPPCLEATVLHDSARREQRAHGGILTEHLDLIAPTRALLQATGKPYVIENVMGAKLIDPVVLCGSMFGLGVVDNGVSYHLERHRQFETNWPLSAPRPCAHQKPVVGVYGDHARNRSKTHGGRGTKDPWSRPHPAIMAEAMGLWRPLPAKAISQGIPPSFATHVAGQLIAHLETLRLAA